MMTEAPRCTVRGEAPTNDPTASVPTDAKLADGQHADHWTMCPGEIIKAGFVRPVRMSYRHVGMRGPKHPTRPLTEKEIALWGASGRFACFEEFPLNTGSDISSTGRYWTQAELDSVDKGCGTVTRMPQLCAETYAAEPGYYGKTFCCGCGQYLKVGEYGEFVWEGTEDRVGT